MFELVIMTASFLGIVGASCKFLNLDPAYAPLFSISLIGILLFLFALAGFLATGTYLVVGLGGGFALCFVASRIKKARGDIFTLFRFSRMTPGAVFGGLIVLSFCITFNMQFTVVDDFVFWGIAGKYLVLFDHLPRADTTIIARHLMYTPGTSLVHSFFHGLTGDYRPSFAYFSQNMILISALFVVIRKQQMEKSLIRLCLMVVLLTLFSGSVFTKLQVDYLLTILFFAVLWIYYTDDTIFPKLLAISAPICFLFLIKQIGFLLGLLLLVIISVDLILNGTIKKNRTKALGFLMSIGGFLLLLNRLWACHCLEMGFTAFNSAMTLDNILAALKIFSDETIQKGFLIYAKAIFLGPADRFNLPYLFWYVLLGFLWFFLSKRMTLEEQSRYGMLAKMMTIAFVFYLVMIYFFQIVVFGVGESFDHTVGLTRYLNVLFAQIVIFTLLFSVGRLWFKKTISGKMLLTGVIGVILILGISRIEKTIRLDRADIQAEHLAQKIVMNTDRNRQNRICVVPGMDEQFLGIKLLYHLLPDRVDYNPFPVATREGFMAKLVQYEYVLFYESDNRVNAWVKELSGFPLEVPGFYRIIEPSSPFRKEPETLRKLF